MTSDLCENLSAIDLAKVGSVIIGGKGGGGRSDFAQAGGSDISKIQESIHSIENEITTLIKK